MSLLRPPVRLGIFRNGGTVRQEERKHSVLVKGKKELAKILSGINRPFQTQLP